MPKEKSLFVDFMEMAFAVIIFIMVVGGLFWALMGGIHFTADNATNQMMLILGILFACAVIALTYRRYLGEKREH